MQSISVTLPANSIYVSGTVNGVDKVWTNTSTGVWETTADRTDNETYHVELTIVASTGATTTESFTVYYGVLNLITDRTATDVSTVIRLSQKGWANMTEEERSAYLSSLKGSYNATDLNRVGGAVQYIANRLAEYGVSVSVHPKVDWSRSDFPMPDDMDAYLADIRTLRSLYEIDLPSVPNDMEGFTWQEANNIEQILVELDFIISQISLAWFYSGEIHSGEV